MDEGLNDDQRYKDWKAPDVSHNKDGKMMKTNNGENGVSGTEKGLGAEKNAKIFELLKEISDGRINLAGNILQIIQDEPDPSLAIEVTKESMKGLNRGVIADAISAQAIRNPEEYAKGMIALIEYDFKNNLRGERFWKNPLKKNETLFVDDDGELISFLGNIATIDDGDSKYPGLNYIEKLGEYEVLSGPNKGKIFRGDLFNGEPGGRPITKRSA